MKKTLLSLIFIFFFGISYSQNVIYVDSSVTSSGNGSSWSTAMKTITEAIDISASSDTIKIAKGTYFEDTTLIIPHALMLRGGYPTGGGITQDTSTNRTIIDGDSTHGVISKKGDFDLSINHLIIQRGNTTYGGGISNISELGSILTIENCIIRNNIALDGGGIYSWDSSSSTSPISVTINIRNSSIYKNTSSGSAKVDTHGGGIYTYTFSSSPSASSCTTFLNITNSLIYNNLSYCYASYFSAYGGGIYSYTSSSDSSHSLSSIIITNSSLYENRATCSSGDAYGGGLYSYSDSSLLNITNCNIYSNLAFGSSDSYGGGIYSGSFRNPYTLTKPLSLTSSVVITNCSLYYNQLYISSNFSSSSSGGGIYSSSAFLRVINSSIYNNYGSGGGSGDAYGGGISSFFGSVSINKSNIYNNNVSASSGYAYGGGVSSSYGSIDIVNSSVYGNNATGARGYGGGLSNNNSYSSEIVVSNCEINNNKSTASGGGIYSNSTGFSYSSIVSIINSNINNNTSYDGGGIFSSSSGTSTVNIKNSNVYNNNAVRGGGINSSSHVNVTNSSVNNNTAIVSSGTAYGGGIYSGFVNITNSRVYNNSVSSPSTSYGGGIYGNYVTITNSSVYNNSVHSSNDSYGGGIYSPESANIINSSIYKNTASTTSGRAYGGGVYFSASYSYRSSIINSFFIDNLGGTTPHYFYSGSKNYFSINYNYFSGIDLSATGVGNFNGTIVDPLFVDSASGNYRLKLGSPLINAGNNTSIPADKFDVDNDSNYSEKIQIDLDSNARIIGGTVDLGPYETTSILTYLTLKVCDKDSLLSPSEKYTWKKSGIFNDTIINSFGYDSVIIINLKIGKPSSSNLIISVCDSMQSPSGNFTWKASGTYFDTISNWSGCDSFMIIKLTVFKSSSSVLSITSCNSMLSPSGKYTWTKSGKYYDTIQNSNGCDSFITINLMLNKSSSSTLSETVCDKMLSPSGKYIWTSTGTYQDTMPNMNGCDSIITVNLIVKKSATTNLILTVCNSITSPSGNYIWTESGTYSDTIPNYNGCDSIITVNLTIDSVDLTLTNNSNTITANQSGAMYQWLDCTNDSIIVGETKQNYTPTINGNYAVILNYLSCIDTSACININNVGIQKNTLNADVKIYPNPTNGIFIIDFGNSNSRYNISITDVLGKTILEFENNKAQEKIDLSNYASGVYFVNIANHTGNKSIKLMKE